MEQQTYNKAVELQAQLTELQEMYNKIAYPDKDTVDTVYIRIPKLKHWFRKCVEDKIKDVRKDFEAL